MTSNTLLGFTVPNDTKKIVLEKIIKNIQQDKQFQHVVSLNPEIITAGLHNLEFSKVIRTAQISIIDGTGVVVAGKLLGIPVTTRITGTDLMSELMDLAGEMSLTVVLIGGKGNVANSIAECYKQKYKNARFFGLEGFKDIANPTDAENEAVNSIVAATRPSLVFVSFGSPAQELWIDRHKNLFEHSTVLGVGGAFDFLSGNISRAPVIIRRIGLEWLYRLIVQPWRWKRQLNLIAFMWLVLKQKLHLQTWNEQA